MNGPVVVIAHKSKLLGLTERVDIDSVVLVRGSRYSEHNMGIMNVFGLTFLVLAIAILIVVGYGCLIRKKRPDQVWSWWNSLVATLVSVLLGVSVAIFIFYLQNSATQSQQRQKYLSLLDTELAATWQALQTVDNPLEVRRGDKTYTFYIGFLESSILEEAARSGRFDEIETRALFKLLRYIRFHNMILNLLLNSLPHLQPELLRHRQEMQMLWKSHKETRDELVNNIQAINHHFQLEALSKRIKDFPPVEIDTNTD